MSALPPKADMGGNPPLQFDPWVLRMDLNKQ
jgi:hypothetical protein